jgi:aspartate/methionine/tyrosine aminotransferase
MVTDPPGITDTNCFVSDRAASLRLSGIKEMAMLSAGVEDAASLAWGVPSFKTPDYILAGVIDRLEHDQDIGKYALPDGLAELRRLVSRKHMLDTGISANADEHVMITAGNMEGVYSLLQVITNPGDEIILTDPCFASHIQQVSICGGKAVFWCLDENNAWSLDIDSLSTLISRKTKAIIINSPSNPTGRIFSKANLLTIGELAKTHGFLVVLDDPYSQFTYENKDKYFNLASQIDLFENIVYLFSFSKAYAMSGWRLGYMILPASLKKQLIKVHDLNLICASRVSQAAGIVALSGDAHHLHDYQAAFARRRELICKRLSALPHVFDYNKPQGAYYVFPRILMQHRSSREFCLELLEKARVTLAPGSAFGPSGEHHVRMAYCVAEETINLAFDRLEAYFNNQGHSD